MFITEKVDVIAFSPVVQAGWNDVLNEAADKGIPVILSDRGVSEKDRWLAATSPTTSAKPIGVVCQPWIPPGGE